MQKKLLYIIFYYFCHELARAGLHGISNLNICYWKTKTLDKKFLQQPLFKQMCDVLRKYGYEVCSFNNNDFYPITVRDMGKFHILPDSCSLNSIGINGIVTIKCRSIK